jgi:hypothetical protein
VTVEVATVTGVLRKTKGENEAAPHKFNSSVMISINERTEIERNGNEMKSNAADKSKNC